MLDPVFDSGAFGCVITCFSADHHLAGESQPSEKKIQDFYDWS